MKRFHLLLMVLFAIAATAGAQETEKKKHKKKKEKEKVQVFNYVVDDPMDAFGNVPPPQPETMTTLRFPDFYSITPTREKDTTYSFEVYDSRDSVVDIDTLHDAGIIRFISMFKSYNDPVHTYVDKNGQKQPLPVSRIIRRWDKTNNRWMCIDYASNKYIMLVEEPGTVVRTAEKTVSLPNNGKRALSIQYYKTTEQIR